MPFYHPQIWNSVLDILPSVRSRSSKQNKTNAQNTSNVFPKELVCLQKGVDTSKPKIFSRTIEVVAKSNCEEIGKFVRDTS